MKEEPKFYAIDAAIEIAENPKYEEVVPTRVEALKEIRKGGETKVPFNKIVKESIYTRWNSVETTNEDKIIGRLRAIENLKNNTVSLTSVRVPLEGNLEKLEKNIKSLNRLQAKGIIAVDDESVETIKAQAAKHLTENPKGEFEEEIEEILGDPIEEVEIPEEETPKEEGKK